jgi:hypothetical protein
MLDKKQLEKLMWKYAKETGADNIIGLHVCDNFLKWMSNELMKVYYI